jgi:hypothetical protein
VPKGANFGASVAQIIRLFDLRAGQIIGSRLVDIRDILMPERILQFSRLTEAEREKYRALCRAHRRSSTWTVQSQRVTLRHPSTFHAIRGLVFGAKEFFYDKPRLEAYEKKLLTKYKCDYIDPDSFPDCGP